MSTDIVQIHKMVFVFNAILAGWTVRMIDERTFEFKKDRATQDVNLDDYLRRFVMHNLSIENMSARRGVALSPNVTPIARELPEETSPSTLTDSVNVADECKSSQNPHSSSGSTSREGEPSV